MRLCFVLIGALSLAGALPPDPAWLLAGTAGRALSPRQRGKGRQSGAPEQLEEVIADLTLKLQQLEPAGPRGSGQPPLALLPEDGHGPPAWRQASRRAGLQSASLGVQTRLLSAQAKLTQQRPGWGLLEVFRRAREAVGRETSQRALEEWVRATDPSTPRPCRLLSNAGKRCSSM